MSLSDLREKVSSAEMAGWMALYRIEPFGDFRDDFRTAQVLHQNAEMHRDRNKRAKPFDIWDFMPFHKRPEEKGEVDLTTGDIAAKLRGIFGRK
jgi:hypothetical protein